MIIYSNKQTPYDTAERIRKLFLSGGVEHAWGFMMFINGLQHMQDKGAPFPKWDGMLVLFGKVMT